MRQYIIIAGLAISAAVGLSGCGKSRTAGKQGITEMNDNNGDWARISAS
ncbi:MAG: hypothetical protein LBB90_07735 [Tannerella sp.]|nr:hypothetical protein [Tannerella sp.]